MKHLGAVLAAIAMVAVAILLNGAIHDDDPDTDAVAADASTTKLRVVCATEFAEACEALAADDEVAAVAEFETQRPGDTADALADGAPGFDLWLTSLPWPGIASSRAGGDAGLGDPGDALATSPLSIVAKTQRTRAIGRTCEPTGPVGSCIFGVSGERFDALGVVGDPAPAKFAVAPTTETAGILALAAISDGWFENGPAFDTTDIDIDVEFRSELSRLAGSTVTSSPLVGPLLTIPKYSVAVDLNVDHQLSGTASGDQYQVLDLRQRADAIAVPAATDAGRRAVRTIGRDRLVDALTDIGWSEPDGTVSPLPDPAVLDDLATRWNA